MTVPEFQAWVEFYKLYPFDDLHRYYRPAAMVSVSLGGGDVKSRLEYLAPEPVPEGLSDADLNTMKALGFKPSMKG